MNASVADGFGRAAYGGARASAPRIAVAQAADAMRGRAFSVQDLADAVRAGHPRIGLATVYRAVGAMDNAGFIEQVGTRDGAALYARCPGDDHHHHMLCTGCGAVADVPCPVQGTFAGPEVAGFRVTGHRLVLYGLCACCDPEGREL